MKNLSVLPAAISVLLLIGCQTDKHARAIVNPSPVVASSEIYYQVEEGFRTYFGPEGIAALQSTLEEAQPHNQIHIDFSDP